MGRLLSVIRKLILTFFSFLVVLIYLSISLGELLFKIRIGRLKGRFGHFTVDTETHLTLEAISRKKSTDFFLIYPWEITNSYWCELIAQVKPVIKNKFIVSLILLGVNPLIKKILGRNIVTDIYISNGGDYSILSMTDPQVRIKKPADLFLGKQLLGKLGLPANSKIITIHNRDSAYLDQKTGTRCVQEDFRDFPIKDMNGAIVKLIQMGFYVVRIGAISSQKLEFKSERVIDYVNSPYRDDFGDIFLGTRAVGHFGADSGAHCIALSHRIPISMVNMTISAFHAFIGHKFCKGPVILKHVVHKATGKSLNLKELLELTSDCYYSHHFEEKNLLLLNNSSDEIADAAEEFALRLSDDLKLSVEDLKMQEKFWLVFDNYSPVARRRDSICVVGTLFLKNNPHLLEGLT